MNQVSLRVILCATTFFTLGGAGVAMAQTGANTQPGGGNALEEVVVTATRQTSTVNRVPLSVTAATQTALNDRGIKEVGDLQRTAPALFVSNRVGGAQQFAIRGVQAGLGSATVGVYLDDVPLQKRNVVGPNVSNGTPAPPLFDLERVEVLRGPQGTLYGGSSQGGTVRFILPSPSLTTYSGSARAEVSSIKFGGISRELSGAIGGPIIQDKLGFRLSAAKRHTAGYVDMVDVYNRGALIYKDANSQDVQSIRVALTVAPTEDLTITASLFKSETKDRGGPQTWNKPIPQTSFTTTSPCYDTRRVPGTAGLPAAIPCPTGVRPSYVYQRPSFTYGPFDYFGRNVSITRYLQPSRTNFDLASVTADYDMGEVTLKSITSYLYDQTGTVNTSFTTPVIANIQRTVESSNATASGFGLNQQVPLFGPNFGKNRRNGVIQEFRLARVGERLNWVGGVFYSNVAFKSEYCADQDTNASSMALYGMTPLQVYGVPNLTPAQDPLYGGCATGRKQGIKDVETAVFGEATYSITESLKVIGGLRFSRVSFDYTSALFGELAGWSFPTVANTGLTSGSVQESPLTPKIGVQYDLSPTKLIYVSAAKGFRAGGVNTPVTESLCGAALRNVGLSIADVPATYDGDSVWSYEGGAKFRLLDGRLQLNGSAFRVDWTGIQTTITGVAGCPQSWVQNAATARSEGFDLEAQARLMDGLTANLAMGYTDARYTKAATTPPPLSGAAPSIIVNKGDPIPVPKFQINVGLEYSHQIAVNMKARIRGDISHSGKYLRGVGPGAASFAPDTRNAAAATRVNLRGGITLDKVQVDLFANNLLDAKDELTNTGSRTGCSIPTGAACTTYTANDPFPTTSYGTPREIGITASYRF